MDADQRVGYCVESSASGVLFSAFIPPPLADGAIGHMYFNA